MTHEIGIARVTHVDRPALTARAAKSPALRLHGAILTPTGFIEDGTVVVRDERITHVLDAPSPGDGINIETDGLICPGFVDTHNHAAYAVFPRERLETTARGRFDWRLKTRGGTYVVPKEKSWYTENISKPFKKFPAELRPSLYLYGQVRGLIGGATTMLIEAEYPDPTLPQLLGFVRDFSDWNDANYRADWPAFIYGVLDIGCVPDDLARAMALALTGGTARLLVHLGEGDDDFARGEFFSLRVAKNLLTANTALIHALALVDEDWKCVEDAGASVIWSPCSNERLYGRSLAIDQIRTRKINIALAPDWSVTGSSTILDEIRYARMRFDINAEWLLDMVTVNAARVLGTSKVGSIVVGNLADMLVFQATSRPTTRTMAAEQITSASIDAISLVVLGGIGVYGDQAMMATLAAQAGLPPAARLDIPFKGTTLNRFIRFEDGRHSAFSGMTADLRAAKPDMADLWEDNGA